MFCPAWAARVTTEDDEVSAELNVSHPFIEMPHPDRNDDTDQQQLLKFQVTTYWLTPSQHFIGRAGVALCRRASGPAEGNIKQCQKMSDDVRKNFHEQFKTAGLSKGSGAPHMYMRKS